MTSAETSRVFLDACCLINLFATDRIAEILAALPYRFCVSRYVADHEVLRLETGEAAGSQPSLSLDELAAHGALTIEKLETRQELTELVRFATVLDDGEASICALAVLRGGAIATDDRKALRVMGQWAPSTQALQTPDLLHQWATEERVSRAEMRQALCAIRDRARFIPRHQAPHSAWWRNQLG